MSDRFPIHFFTLATGGDPFIRHHLDVFGRLPVEWHWHIVEGRDSEGLADLPEPIEARFRDRVTVHRNPPGGGWRSRSEMLNAPLAGLRASCLLWQVAMDDFWTPEQILACRDLFLEEPTRKAALFGSRFTLDSGLVIDSRRHADGRPASGRAGAWRFEPGDRWIGHAPPLFASRWARVACLLRRARGKKLKVKLGMSRLFDEEATEARGLVCQRLEAGIAGGLSSEEIREGYAGALEQARRQPSLSEFPSMLFTFFRRALDEKLAPATGGVDAADRPVFILSAGGRTGSTLLQRLVTSTGAVMVWGEHGAILLNRMEEMLDQLSTWRNGEGRFQYEILTREGWNQWIPNVNPPLDWFVHGIRASLQASLGGAARALGYPRWGFKEIRYGGDVAVNLRRLFPGCAILLSVRHPAACLRSIKRCEWYERVYGADPARFLAEWARLGRSLTDALPALGRAALIRHEDLVSDPESYLQRMAALIDVAPERFDRRGLDKVIAGEARSHEELDSRDRDALAGSAVRQCAERLGYA